MFCWLVGQRSTPCISVTAVHLPSLFQEATTAAKTSAATAGEKSCASLPCQRLARGCKCPSPGKYPEQQAMAARRRQPPEQGEVGGLFIILVSIILGD